MNKNIHAVIYFNDTEHFNWIEVNLQIWSLNRTFQLSRSLVLMSWLHLDHHELLSEKQKALIHNFIVKFCCQDVLKK